MPYINSLVDKLIKVVAVKVSMTDKQRLPLGQ